MIRPFVLFLPGDNPMQAEECSHSGLSSNFFCRTCMVGGTKKFKVSDEGYSTLFEVSCFVRAVAWARVLTIHTVGPVANSGINTC